MKNEIQRRLAAAASVTILMLAAQPALATFQEVTSFDGCFTNKQTSTGTPLFASGACASAGVGGTGTAHADLGTGELGALASTTGRGNAEAQALFSTTLSFLPNQVVPLTVTMHFTGSVTGGLASGPNNNTFLFQAAVNLNGINFGVTGADSRSGFQIIANGQSGVGSFLHAVVSATGASLVRDKIDMTLTFSETFNIGANGLAIPLGGYVDTQVNPAVIGTSSTVDFLDPAAVSFTVPAGTRFTSEGFLETTTSPIPEPSTLLLLGSGLAAAGLVRKRHGRRRARRASRPQSCLDASIYSGLYCDLQ